MPHQLEITVKESMPDIQGRTILTKAADYFDIAIEGIRTVSILTMDVDLTPEQKEAVATQIFINPVTQEGGFGPLDISFDWCVWVGFRPGVKDTAGETALEAMMDLLGRTPSSDEAVYTSKRFCFSGANLKRQDMEKVAGELLANDIIQQWRVYQRDEWLVNEGVGMVMPKVDLQHQPTVTTISVKSDAALQKVSDERNLSLNVADIPVIRAYFEDPAVRQQRQQVGLDEPTDIELEYISQARSDHCNHNTFRGRFYYEDLCTGDKETLNSLFKTFIEEPTLKLKDQKAWVVSVLWDNAGVGRFDPDNLYVITGETHNSPSNMEAYGGAITGIVGVYRDPLGTGKGARLIMGGYGYCVGGRDYDGPLQPRLHPRRLLDGVIEGVKDGGNKSGIPTAFGQVTFHPGYMGKCLVFVTALGIMPSRVDGTPAHEKKTSPGDLVVMCGGRVGKDGIHGVTASSESFSAGTPAGHVQIGDPYTQKKMHDFLLEARDHGLIAFITDNGGGGLSSSVGESARDSNGCEIDLEKVPLKYNGLDQWEIWVSESQERMTVAVHPNHIDRFMTLSGKHAVESTVIGRYTDSGKLHIRYQGKTCAHVDMDLLTQGFPQWEFEAQWQPPSQRGLFEPVLTPPGEYGRIIEQLLEQPNIASKEWIVRQYDHEVQGTSIIKPLVGVNHDVVSDASVIRPVLTSEKGLAYAQALLPNYAAIDAYHMTACTIDEAVRRLLAVGGDPDHVGGVDNFCWPNIQFDPDKNPDGKFKAAQLVRSCRALKDICLAYEIPLLSGKDSMYVDGHLPGALGETHKVSAPETIQFSTVSVVKTIEHCVTMDVKAVGDFVYLLGTTRNELGGSEYYRYFGYTGLNVPQVRTGETKPLYQGLYNAVKQRLPASIHGIYSGGLGVHLALTALGGDAGLEIDLANAPQQDGCRDEQLLFSESPGRFIVSIAPEDKPLFEACFENMPVACIGRVAGEKRVRITGQAGDVICEAPLKHLKQAWQKRFGELI